MHPPEVKQEALRLLAEGLNDCEIGRRLGISRSTVMTWRRPTYVPRTAVATCPRCWRAAKPMRFSSEDYAELLGLYLGDGSISRHPRTDRLRISLDLRYPLIIAETEALLARCFPANRVDVVERGVTGACVNVSLYSTHLRCLFPQHGRGKKHERTIELEHWQAGHVEAATWGFLRGLIRSDGCVFINRTDVHRPEPYEYLSYDFSNMSKDIIDLFTNACAGVGIDDYRVNCNRRGLWDVRINRRASVDKLLEHVGRKA
jgi:Homeodomain-like domain/LAGLIDADG-like domain